MSFIQWGRKSKPQPAQPACCNYATWTPVADLGHASGFDFDLGKCSVCGGYVMCVAYTGTGNYHPVREERADYYLRLLKEDPERLRLVLGKWADG